MTREPLENYDISIARKCPEVMVSIRNWDGEIYYSSELDHDNLVQ